MNGDFTIGRVLSVDTSQVLVELDNQFASQVRTTFERTMDVGRINSYISIPVGTVTLVGMVTRVSISEDLDGRSDRSQLRLPTEKRLLRAILVGTVDGPTYTQGIKLFPQVESPVFLLSSEDLRIMFDADPVSMHSTFRIPIGSAALAEDITVRADPDTLFGKHVAVLGSTGSGKSCTIASLLQAVIGYEGVLRTNIVILDTNGEYSSAFPNALHLNGTRASVGPLSIPYWFMNADEFVRLFAAAAGTQRPALLDALRIARGQGSEADAVADLTELLLRSVEQIVGILESSGNISKDLFKAAAALRVTCAPDSLSGEVWDQFEKVSGLKREVIEEAADEVARKAAEHIEGGKYPSIVPEPHKEDMRQALSDVRTRLNGLTGRTSYSFGASADSPRYFSKQTFRSKDLEEVIRRESTGGGRYRENLSTMLLRIDRLLADKRYSVLFGEPGADMNLSSHALAAFLRDVLGLESADPSPLEQDTEGVLPFYVRQRAGTKGHRVVVIDLSLLAAEVLQTVTGLLGRLILEFLQRLGDADDQARGSLPVVLVLEEAQNYIFDAKGGLDESPSKAVFERIAREGRKYGLGLVVASQRPSELSKTVLSQCSSFIVHRLQNPEDLRYFRDMVPAVFAPLLDQLPSLAPQTALVLGEGVRTPALVRIRDASPVPRSRDPRFYEYWTKEEVAVPDVEEISRRWEDGE